MKLLMITQKIDKDDDILAVYHDWARDIAKSFEKLSVICLYRGRNELPQSIQVFSLGKEKRRSRIQYLMRLFSYTWKVRNDYDTVLVHMNPVYVLLGWPVWKIMRKKVYLWFAHPAWNWQVKLAYFLSDGVITSVPEAFCKKGGKVKAIGQGIDTNYFAPKQDMARDMGTILYLGRISPSKNIHVLIEALNILKQSGVSFRFSLVGSPPKMPGAAEYDKKIKGMIADFDMAGVTELHGSTPYADTVNWYNKSEIFVNLSPTGHFDKTVLEAMASGCITLASNDAYYNVFPKDLHEFLLFHQGDRADLARILKKVVGLPEAKKDEMRKNLRDIVIKYHSMYTLGQRILQAMSQ